MLPVAMQSGLTAVMFIFAVVWAGDIAAFLGGRQIGGIKLYPSVSPNKTWAGLVSAVVASILVGAVFVGETLSVIIQVAYYKWKKQRVFKMAPLHHHFELMGWPETKIVARFWVLGILFALLSLSTFKIR